MLDHQPTDYEVAMAEQNFQFGHASDHDMEVLRFAHPERDYGGDDPIGDFLGLFDWPW